MRDSKSVGEYRTIRRGRHGGKGEGSSALLFRGNVLLFTIKKNRDKNTITIFWNIHIKTTPYEKARPDVSPNAFDYDGHCNF